MKSDGIRIISSRIENGDKLILEVEFTGPFSQFWANCAEPKPKPAVVPWQDSKIGDVVEIDGRNVRVNETLKIQGVCRLCCFEDVGGLCGVKTMPMNFICDCHPSGCDVYFTEVKE